MRRLTTLLLGLLVLAGAGAVSSHEYTAVHPYSQSLIAARNLEVGSIAAWETDGLLHLKYEAGPSWRLTETRLHVTGATWEMALASPHRCIRDTIYRIDLTWASGDPLTIRAEAGVARASMPGLYASYHFPRRQPRADFTWPPECEEKKMGGELEIDWANLDRPDSGIGDSMVEFHMDTTVPVSREVPYSE